MSRGGGTYGSESGNAGHPGDTGGEVLYIYNL